MLYTKDKTILQSKPKKINAKNIFNSFWVDLFTKWRGYRIVSNYEETQHSDQLLPQGMTDLSPALKNVPDSNRPLPMNLSLLEFKRDPRLNYNN